MTPRPIVYMAHPFQGAMANVEAAKEWLRALILSHTSVDFVAPWIPMVEALGDSDAEQRARGLAIGCDMVRRCDGLVMVGKQVTSGMKQELQAARYFNKPIVDLTGFVFTAIPESIPVMFNTATDGSLLAYQPTPPTPEHRDPWSRFLTARCDVIRDMVNDGKSFEDIAVVLSMEPTQVRLIASTPIKAVAGESFANVRTVIGTTEPTEQRKTP